MALNEKITKFILPKNITATLGFTHYTVGDDGDGPPVRKRRQIIELKGVRTDVAMIKNDLISYLNEMGVSAYSGSYSNGYGDTTRITPSNEIDIETLKDPAVLNGILQQASMRLFAQHDPDALNDGANKSLLKNDPVAQILSTLIEPDMLGKATAEVYRAAFAYTPSQQVSRGVES